MPRTQRSSPPAELGNGVRFIVEFENPHLTVGDTIKILGTKECAHSTLRSQASPQDNIYGKLDKASHVDTVGIARAATVKRGGELVRRCDKDGGYTANGLKTSCIGSDIFVQHAATTPPR